MEFQLLQKGAKFVVNERKQKVPDHKLQLGTAELYLIYGGLLSGNDFTHIGPSISCTSVGGWSMLLLGLVVQRKRLVPFVRAISCTPHGISTKMVPDSFAS